MTAIKDHYDIAAKRAAYQQSRKEQLDLIRGLDAAYRAELAHQEEVAREHGGVPEPGVLERLRLEALGHFEHQGIDLFTSRRIVVYAVEGYLLDCVAVTWLTGRDFMKRARTTEELISILQEEEDRLIEIHGWEFEDLEV
jgi:hypothetical protein